jgi:hypothetical protein
VGILQGNPLLPVIMRSFPFAALMALALPAHSQSPASSPPSTPLLVEKERIVEVAPPPRNAWEPAEVGRELVKREIVAARDRSRAVVRISGDRLLRVNANSQLAILPSLIAGAPLSSELQTPPRDEDCFWQFNALVGCRFWRN